MATTDRITRSEYDAKRRHDYAGPTSTLFPGTIESFTKHCPDWDGKYWHMGVSERGGTFLGPVNVED